MLTVNIHDAKTNLSKLIANAVKGQPFIIAKAGKPLVKVEALVAEDGPAITDRGLGSLRGKIIVPDDIKTPFADDIHEMFYGKP
jgi:antitoxin (DNA-binding transcriptional repressor) of toxin-antitoxin stability system